MAAVKNFTPSEEQEWLDEQEQQITRYLKGEGISIATHLEIEWCIIPIVSVWKSVDSTNHTIWAISGDLPTDYVADDTIRDARAAVSNICGRWADVASSLIRGEQHPGIRIGDPRYSSIADLGDLLQKRAKLLMSWVEDDEKWQIGIA